VPSGAGCEYGCYRGHARRLTLQPHGTCLLVHTHQGVCLVCAMCFSYAFTRQLPMTSAGAGRQRSHAQRAPALCRQTASDCLQAHPHRTKAGAPANCHTCQQVQDGRVRSCCWCVPQRHSPAACRTCQQACPSAAAAATFPACQTGQQACLSAPANIASNCCRARPPARASTTGLPVRRGRAGAAGARRQRLRARRAPAPRPRPPAPPGG